MNVQIGDTVLVTLAGNLGGPIYSGLTYANKPCAAIVTWVYWENLISCYCFKLEGEMQFIKQLSHKSLVDKGHSYWDFRPSQKETPPVVKAEPNNSAKFTISTENKLNLFWQGQGFGAVDKANPFRPCGNSPIQNQDGIKLHSSWAKPPTEGTFEWALVALKNKHKVRRSCWYEQVLVVRIEGIYPCFYSGGSVYSAHPTDLLATDWVLA